MVRSIRWREETSCRQVRKWPSGQHYYHNRSQKFDKVCTERAAERSGVNGRVWTPESIPAYSYPNSPEKITAADADRDEKGTKRGQVHFRYRKAQNESDPFKLLFISWLICPYRPSRPRPLLSRQPCTGGREPRVQRDRSREPVQIPEGSARAFSLTISSSRVTHLPLQPKKAVPL